jgi:hypothetical protein
MSATTTETTITKIRIQFSSEPSGWGSEATDAEAAQAALNCAALAEAYAHKHWPEAEIEADVTSWPDVRLNNWTQYADGDLSGPGDYGPHDTIASYISNHWTEEPLWSAEFDADAYLEANPR